jgi:hypothetical protein
LIELRMLSSSLICACQLPWSTWAARCDWQHGVQQCCASSATMIQAWSHMS